MAVGSAPGRRAEAEPNGSAAAAGDGAEVEVVSSCVSMIALMALFGIGMYPTMVLSNPDPANSLTIYNAASSPATLSTMLVIAVVGMPMVIAYTAAVYWLFRGKVHIDATSY